MCGVCVRAACVCVHVIITHITSTQHSHITLYYAHHNHTTLSFTVILLFNTHITSYPPNTAIYCHIILYDPIQHHIHKTCTSIYCHIIIYYPIQHHIHKTLLFIVILFFITQSNITSTKHLYLLSYHSL